MVCFKFSQKPVSNISWLPATERAFIFIMLMLPTKDYPFWVRALQFCWNHKTHPNEETVEVSKSQPSASVASPLECRLSRLLYPLLTDTHQAITQMYSFWQRDVGEVTKGWDILLMHFYCLSISLLKSKSYVQETYHHNCYFCFKHTQKKEPTLTQSQSFPVECKATHDVASCSPSDLLQPKRIIDLFSLSLFCQTHHVSAPGILQSLFLPLTPDTHITCFLLSLFRSLLDCYFHKKVFPN